MQVSIYQGPNVSTSIDDHLKIMAQQAQAARSSGSDLIIFSEMFLTGYNIGAQRTRELAQAASAVALSQAGEIAAKNNIAILFGFPELSGGNVYNAAVLYDQSGQQKSIYRKSHLFGDIDRSAFTPGADASKIIELNGVKMGILICYDVEFSENVRHLALAGADFVAVPTALMQPYKFVLTKLVPSRAFENQVFVAYANRCDVEEDLNYYGLSCICAPDGSDLARAGETEALISARLNFEDQAASRQLNTHIRDRRPELYKKLVD